jgi:hypothetical protein
MKVLLASFEPRRDRALAGWRFVRKPTRHASSRQFESQPTKTRGRYEHTLNARPNRTIRQFCVSELVPVVKIVADHHEPGIISRSWTEVPNGHVVDRLLGPSAAVLLDGENDGLRSWSQVRTVYVIGASPPAGCNLTANRSGHGELRHDTQLARSAPERQLGIWAITAQPVEFARRDATQPEPEGQRPPWSEHESLPRKPLPHSRSRLCVGDPLSVGHRDRLPEPRAPCWVSGQRRTPRTPSGRSGASPSAGSASPSDYAVR